MDSVLFKFKISRTDSSQFKLDSVENLNTQNVQEIVQEDSIEQNVQELLTELNIQNNSELPSYEQLNAIQLEQGLLLYRADSSIPSIATSTSRSVPVVFIQKQKPVYSYLPEIAYLKVELTNSHFDKFYNKNQLVKSVFTLQSNPITRNNRTYEFPQDTIDQTSQYSNSDKALLQLCSDKPIGDNFLFDVYSPSIDQLCLIWRPLVEKSLYFGLNIGETEEMNSPTKFDTFLRVETFIAPNSTRNNWTKVDGAICKLNFIEEVPNNIRQQYANLLSTNHYTCLKNDSEYLIRKAFFISVDGSAFEQLLFQGPFLQENYPIEQFKTKFIALVREIKNIDSQFEIKKFNYFENGQSKQGYPFDSSIFVKLKPKTLLKCNLRKVVPLDGENPQQVPSQLVQYDVDLISQNENYSKAYF